METFKSVIEQVGVAIDAAGVIVLILGILVAAAKAMVVLVRRGEGAYRTLRQNIGRAILLGLEFLVAADIIRTVALTPTMTNVLVLGVIILIRTFLSMALEVELEGRWPWQRGTQPQLRRDT